jgi:hypothetical protein
MIASEVSVGEIVHEVDDLHNLFLAWYAGEHAKNRNWYDLNIASRMDSGFSIVAPDGAVLDYGQILDLIYEGHGMSNEFRIKTRYARMLWQSGDFLLIAYEEWQHHAVNTPVSENGRISTALLIRDASLPGGLRWLHVHETWLPDAVQKAGDYNF